MNSQTDYYREQGRAAYKREDYAIALQHFDRAIGRSPSVELYDRRAACHDKLKDLGAAIKDAKKVIQLAKEDPTGYIRAGDILCKMDKKKVALEVYDLGLRNVKHVGLRFETLKKVQSELKNELSPNRNVDPLTKLPRELAEQVLGYLSFRQLINVCRVSKGWSQFIDRTPTLWHHLDLSHARRYVKNGFVSRAINVGRTKLRSVTLKNLDNLPKAFLALAHNCVLEEVTILDSLVSNEIVRTFHRLTQLKSLTIGTGGNSAEDRTLYILRSIAPTLETLVFDKIMVNSPGPWLMQIVNLQFPKLHTLELTVPAFSARLDSFVSKLQDVMPNLHAVKLHEHNPVDKQNLLDFQGLKHLTRLDLLLDITSANKVKIPATLKSFALGTWQPRQHKFFDDDPAHDPLQWRLSLLQELKIGIAGVPVNCLQLLLGTNTFSSEAPPSLLHTLSMAKSDVKADGALTSRPKDSNPSILQHPRLATLEHFSLEGCLDACDETMYLLKEYTPTLRSLNVSGSEVTGIGIKTLIQNGSLKKLVAYDCRNVGTDAIDWARDQGVKVEFGMRNTLSGGKKVRNW